jgi:hypothetical protein
MSFSAELRAFLGLDTKGFTAPLRQAAQETQSAGNSIEQSFNRSGAAHENLLASNHRVARQFQNFSKDLLSGASAADVFSSGLEGIERALRLPLGALAGIGIGAVAVQQLGKVIAEYKKLNEEVDKLNQSKPAPAFQTLENLAKTADEADKKFEQLSKRLRDAQIPFSITGLIESLTGGKTPAEKKETGVTRVEARVGEVEKARVKNDLRDQPDFVQKAAAIEEKFFDVVQRLGQRGVVELDRELENLAKDIARTRSDVLKLSLDQLAAGPNFGDQNHASLQAISNADQARQVKDLEDRARDLVLNQGDIAGAAQLRGRAADIRNGIGTLKDSEKDITGALRGAIDSAGVFREMLGALKAITFKNQ